MQSSQYASGSSGRGGIGGYGSMFGTSTPGLAQSVPPSQALGQVQGYSGAMSQVGGMGSSIGGYNHGGTGGYQSGYTGPGTGYGQQSNQLVQHQQPGQSIYSSTSAQNQQSQQYQQGQLQLSSQQQQQQQQLPYYSQLQQQPQQQQQQQIVPSASQPSYPQYGGSSGFSMSTSGTYGSSGTPGTILRPQPVETVNRDEDPVYGPLGRAGAKVDRAMVMDEEISYDLSQLVNAATQDPYPALPSASQAFKPLKITKNVPLPDALHQEIRHKEQIAKMGLFEEIERAWFTVGNKLFLWDYTDGRDFSRYDEQADIIQAVGLVRARRDVFVDDITHILIICTSTKATLLGLSRTSPREINLFSTNLSVALPTPVLSVHGTFSGRILLLGADRNVYELSYGMTSGWIYGSGTTAKLHNRTGTNFLVYSSSSSVIQLAVDPKREYAYALRADGKVEMFDLRGDRWTSTGEVRSSYESQGQSRGNKVALITAVGQDESTSVCCMTVAADGTRAYCTFEPRTGGSSTFAAARTRSSPYPDFRPSPTSFYSSGTLFGVQYNDQNGYTQMTTITPYYGGQSSAREYHNNNTVPYLFQEYVQLDSISSQVWAIAEIPSGNPVNDPGYLCKKGSAISLNPLARQTLAQARQFLILAASGLYFATMPRAVDMLGAELEVDKEAAIMTVRQKFGGVQLAAMGLQLGTTSDLKASDLSSAVSSILLASGAPVVQDTTSGRIITYSARHDGLALILSRLLRTIWANKVVLSSIAANVKRYTLGVPQRTLEDVQSRLEAVRRYMDEYPFPRTQAEGDAKVAWDQEEMSLNGMTVLVRQAIEAINFLLLLADYKISDVILKCDDDTRMKLESLTFSNLLTATAGRDIAKRLVTALIEQQIGQELGIDTLSEILQQRCGSFCQPGDVVMYKAEESIRRAESARDAIERRDYLNESLRLFTKAGGSLPLQRLQDVAKRYAKMGFTTGSIELPLHTALQLDPQDKAADYIRDGEHPADPRKSFYASRMDCYALVIEALGGYDEELDQATAAGNPGPVIQKRDEAYALAIASDDELFHFYLYDWQVARRLSEQLLEFETPYIEKYLQITSNSVEERRDLLWKYYARREEYLPAAKALFELATRPSATSLNDRTYYLAQALTSAKSAMSLGADDVEFTSNLQERIDVAQVQVEVARAIEMHHELSPAEKGDALNRLDRDLIGLDDLYQGFARPYRLYEQILLILKTADTRIDDVCEAVWRQLMQQASSANLGSTPVDVKVAETVRELTRRYHPSEAAPLDIVLAVVYSEAANIRGAPGWASEALCDGGIPLRDLWEAVMSLMDENPDEQAFYHEEAAVLAQRWVYYKDQIPAAEIERVASAYLLRTDAGDANERVGQTREKMTAARTASGRY